MHKTNYMQGVVIFSFFKLSLVSRSYSSAGGKKMVDDDKALPW